MPIICGQAARVVPAVFDAINGDGPRPVAVTIGGQPFYFNRPTERIRKHEHMHVVQAARYAPWWARWMPLKWRANFGAAKFWKYYYLEHRANGYTGNRFEQEARDAET